jgi:LacI family transcriptional regulator
VRPAFLVSRRPTLAAVADAAGVSSATVDRVLNSRLPVREATALRVIKAAERIGYHAAGLMRDRLRERATVRRLGFCLQKRNDPFYRAFGEAISAAAARHGPETAVAVIDHMDALEPAAIAAKVLALGRQVDALAVVAVDHPHVTAAIDTLHAEGRPVFTLLSDLSAPQRAAYVGVDNRQAGRTAAWAIRRLARRADAVGGEVAVFVGSHRYLGQEISEISFRSHLREHAPQLHVLDTRVNLEDAQLAHEATLELLARHPKLAGIYVAGGGVAGIIRALREESAPGRIVTVCNELSGEHRSALIDGVIDLVLRTPIERIGEAAVRAMVRALEPGGAPPAGTLLIQPFELYTPENV